MAIAAGLFLAGFSSAEAGTYRDHVWDITFPLEKDAGTYEQRWHTCRPSASTCTRAHRAVDLYAAPGTPVYAAASGRIRWLRTSAAGDWSPTSGSGYALYIDEPGGKFRHFYGHFGPDEPGREDEAFAVNPATGELWQNGDYVTRGQLLGFVGTSGATASGPHLHFELRSLRPDLPVDDPGPDAIDGRSYGDSGATIGTFSYLRYDPFYSLQAAEDRGDYPEGPQPLFQKGDYVRVVGVNNALNVRGPEACDDPISGAGRPPGMVGRVIGGPEKCPEITSRDMWQIQWSDCLVGWSSEFFLEAAAEPDGFCSEYGISTETSGEGTVVLNPSSASYYPGETVEATAVPGEGFSFSHWSGSASGTENPLLVTADSELSFTAHFLRTYEAWKLTQFSVSELESSEYTAPDSDPFQTGVVNLLGYGFGLDIRDPDRSALPRLESKTGEATLVFRRLRQSGDLAYLIEISPDLSEWAEWEPPHGALEVSSNADGATETVRVALPADDVNRRFVRVRAERDD